MALSIRRLPASLRLRTTVLLGAVLTAGMLSSCADSAGAPVPSVEGAWGNTEDSSAPSLDFASDGRVTGTDGCNRLMGHWTQDGTAVTISDLASTMMFCQDVDAWLSAASTAEIDGETLAVFNEDGEPIGTLER
ncbi:heat shock protein HslJ [Arthrobacter sp. UYP6]|uniref:META domain-containing protein n=1 Tax=Arthrobacter sp. UYP6 TaxID=1756378 RepID=UPI00339177BA